MRRYCLFTGCFIGLLLFTAPAWALNYSGLASFDLTSLTFSGIGVSLTPRFQQHDTNVHFGSISEPSVQTAIADVVWVDRSVSTNIPQKGVATAVSTPTALTASIELAGANFVRSSLERNASIVALDTGMLTVSIRHTISQDVKIGDLPANVGTQLLLDRFDRIPGDGSRDSSVAHQQLFNGDGTVTRTGISSVSMFFLAGDRGNLNLLPSGQAGAVPIPDRLWPTLVGMVGAALLTARRYEQGS